MFLQRAPAARLRPFVKTLWATEPGPSALACVPARQFEHVLPTGSMHLVLRLGGAPLRLLHADGRGTADVLSHAVLGGARSRFYAKAMSAPAASVGVQLHPGAVQWLFGVPGEALAERHTALEDLWGLHARELLERLQAAPDVATRLDLLETELAVRLPTVRALHPAVAHALQGMGQALPVHALVQQSGYSHRQFNALFQHAVGLTPKVYARVQRLQVVLRNIHARAQAGAPAQWAEQALAAGFSDQPHFNREFRAMTGVTPERYRRLLPANHNHLLLPFG